MVPFAIPSRGEQSVVVGGVGVDADAQARLEAIARHTGTPAVLRLAVAGGGCSGFQYVLDLAPPQEGDAVVYFGAHSEAGVAIDEISQPFLVGAVLSFEDTMAGQRFRIENPNAVAGCGCGVSFAV